MPTRIPRTRLYWTASAYALVACSDIYSVTALHSEAGAATAGRLAAAFTVASAADVGRGAGLSVLAPQVSLVEESTYVGPFTSRTGSRAYDEPLELIGTDLGISFPYAGKLYFLLGDSWVTDTRAAEQGLDSLAWTDLTPPANGEVPALSWERRADGAFKPFAIDRFGPLKEMSVPVEAFEANDALYVFYYSSARRDDDRLSLFDSYPNRSVLTRADKNDLTKLTWVHDREQTKFKSISVVQDNDMLYIFGAGDYRQSPVHLARVESSDLEDRERWEYYKNDGSWQPAEDAELASLTSAEPDPHAPCVGELSVRKYDSLYFMTYNCGEPTKLEHYVQLRVAERPEGPWSKPQTILRYDQAYGVFVHADPARTGADDGLGEPGLFDDWRQTPRAQGDVYGPYLIPQWFTKPQPGQYEIAYTISSWNPYQVHLMRSTVSVAGVNATP